jgi:hypothetical protein
VSLHSPLLDKHPHLQKLLTHPALQESLNVLTLTPDHLGDVIARTLPQEWLGQDETDHQVAAGETTLGPLTLEWFAALWTYILTNPACIQHVAEQHPILPTNEGVVTILSRGSSVIAAALLPDEVKEALPALGVRTLLPGLWSAESVVVPPAFFE